MAKSQIDEIYARMNDDTEAPDIDLGDSKIQKFFTGKTIFLTGATGFMGKSLVEKILRDLPDINTLYVLVREKKGVPPEEKMKKYFEYFIFDKLRRENPDFEKKVVTIKGDLQEDRLGISEEDRKTLIENTDIIIHNGATVKFDEIVSVSLKVNVLATKHMLDLATECKHLTAFVYVSTAYSHCYRNDIHEEFYDSPGDLKMVHDIIQSDTNAKNGIDNAALKMLMGKWPNIYVFTKSISEDLVRQYGEKGKLPCAIYRPSIVTAAYFEPAAGWIGNLNGPASVFIGAGMGVIHTAYVLHVPVDLIPVDYCISSLIATVHDIPQRWETEKRSLVYNFGSSVVNPVCYEYLFHYLVNEAQFVGSTKTLWHAFFIFCRNKIQFWILHILLHFIPAIFADLALILMGKKPKALNIFFFATKHMSKMFYFVNGGWNIHIPNTMKVWNNLNAADKKIFNFDISNLDWEGFIANYARGGRVYFLKEPTDNAPEGRRRYKLMKKIHYVTVTLLGLLFAYYAFKFLHHLVF